MVAADPEHGEELNYVHGYSSPELNYVHGYSIISQAAWFWLIADTDLFQFFEFRTSFPDRLMYNSRSGLMCD